MLISHHLLIIISKLSLEIPHILLLFSILIRFLPFSLILLIQLILPFFGGFVTGLTMTSIATPIALILPLLKIIILYSFI